MFIGSWENVLWIIRHDVLLPPSNKHLFSLPHVHITKLILFSKSDCKHLSLRKFVVEFIFLYCVQQKSIKCSTWVRTHTKWFHFVSWNEQLKCEKLCISQVKEKHQLSFSLSHSCSHTLADINDFSLISLPQSITRVITVLRHSNDDTQMLVIQSS
jgi:hypothetical protein